MGIEVNWLPPKSRDGVRERSFNFEVSGTVVPGVVWLPAEPGSPVPLILLGHGGSGHKRSSRNLELSRWFAKEAGMASMAIDGPYHGERVTSPLGAGEYQGMIREEGAGLVVDRMVRDPATIEAMASVDSIDTAALGYIGLSMGTRFGVPLASALGGDLRSRSSASSGLSRQPGCTRAWTWRIG